jgi:branched-subunit amino acid transport protein
MSILLVFLIGGLLTFGMRFSFIYQEGRKSMPERIQRALRLVAPAVLSAIAVPELLQDSNGLHLGLANHRLVAGLLAVLVAWWIGFGLLLTLQLLP